MTPEFSTITAAELAYRIVARGGSGDWLIFVAPPDRAEAAAVDLTAGLQEALDEEAALIDARLGTKALVAGITSVGVKRPLVAWGFDAWSDEKWRHVDLLRSRLERAGPSVMVLTLEASARLEVCAPNFASWIGPSVHLWAPEPDVIPSAVRDERLASLRAWSGLTDDEMIRRAETGQLPADPQFAEWLTLLDRGDLIG